MDFALQVMEAGNSNSSFPDVQLHIVDAPLGAGPESILPIVVMDSGLTLRVDVSSLRKQGPIIITGVCCSGSRQPLCQNARPRRMGPCFRRDDTERLRFPHINRSIRCGISGMSAGGIG